MFIKVKELTEREQGIAIEAFMLGYQTGIENGCDYYTDTARAEAESMINSVLDPNDSTHL